MTACAWVLTRHPGPPLWLAVKDAIATMPRDDARASFHTDRTRWAFSAGSQMADGRVDLRLMRANLGHVSPPTTSQHLHADDDWRQSATDAKHRPRW